MSTSHTTHSTVLLLPSLALLIYNSSSRLSRLPDSSIADLAFCKANAYLRTGQQRHTAVARPSLDEQHSRLAAHRIPAMLPRVEPDVVQRRLPKSGVQELKLRRLEGQNRKYRAELDRHRWKVSEASAT